MGRREAGRGVTHRGRNCWAKIDRIKLKGYRQLELNEDLTIFKEFSCPSRVNHGQENKYHDLIFPPWSRREDIPWCVFLGGFLIGRH